MAQALAGLRWADSRDSTRREVLQAVEALLDSQGMPKSWPDLHRTVEMV